MTVRTTLGRGRSRARALAALPDRLRAIEREQTKLRTSLAKTAAAIPERLRPIEQEQANLRTALSSVRTSVSANTASIRVADEAIAELRGLGGRVSELADLVTELLVLAATKEDPEFQELITRYKDGVA
jgi:chromosome segregation ATPase